LLVLRGNHSFANGDYGQAIIDYMKARDDRPDAPVVDYDLGNVYYALGETEPAVRALSRSIQGEGQELRFRAHFNLGGIYYDLGRYEDAVAQYVEALRVYPVDVDAKVNLELSLKRLQSGSGEQPAPQSKSEPSRSTQQVLDLAREKERTLWSAPPDEQEDDSTADW
jgi:tetratricopeptide (TPR) repeat protein